MSPATRRVGAWAVVPLALATVLVPGGVWAGRVAWTTWADLVPQRNAVLPGRRAELGARAEDVSLVTGDGVALRGWYAPSRNGAAVVLVHGLGGDRTQLLRPAARLAGLGYGVLVFDLRGHGESGGQRTSLGGKERADVRAAVDFVASRSDVRPGRLAAVGYSIGGMAVELEAAADRRVSAVDLAGSFPSLSAMVHLHEPGPRGYVTLFTLRAVGVDDRDVLPEDSLCEVAARPRRRSPPSSRASSARPSVADRLARARISGGAVARRHRILSVGPRRIRRLLSVGLAILGALEILYVAAGLYLVRGGQVAGGVETSGRVKISLRVPRGDLLGLRFGIDGSRVDLDRSAFASTSGRPVPPTGAGV